MTWITTNWPLILSALWALDQILVSLLGKSTVLDGITTVLKSLGAGSQTPPPAA